MAYTGGARARYSRRAWPSTAPAPSAAPSPAPPPRPSGPPSSRSTSASSASTTTTSSCSARFVTAGAPAYPVGLALHVANGALFGAVYAQRRAARCPVPAAAARAAGRAGRAPRDLAGDRRARRACTRRRRLPQLWGTGRAFAQATWRHLLFGAVLGELERRLNPPDSEPEPDRRGGGRLQRPRLGRAPGLDRTAPERASSSPAPPASPGATSSRPARPPATSVDRRAAVRAAPTCATPAAPARCVADARPDVVYHLAARAHVGESWRTRSARCTTTWR